jgi:beta-xylosidase
MEDQPTARNCWAPETWYDATREEYLILWATTIPGRFPDTDASGDDGFNHRVYATTTTDFQTFTPTRLFYDPGFEVIDATLVQDGERLLMFVKNETLRPNVAKYVYLTTAPSPDGPWSPPGPPITEAFREGPSVARVGGRWFLYCDFYALGLYALYTSPDLQSWTDESESLRMPEGVRHGTALWIPRTVADALDALVPAAP